MKALVLESIGNLVLKELPLPEPGPGEVLLRVRACGVCGSDLPRIFEKGMYSMPMTPGHEFAGEVVAAHDAADAHLVGTRAAVFPLLPCMQCASCKGGDYAVCSNYDYYGSRRNGGFAEYIAVKRWNLVPMADGVGFETAAMAEPAAVALHALKKGGLQAGEHVGIAGAGPIGLMLAAWAERMGAASVTLWDIDQAKVDFAEKMGFCALNSKAENPAEKLFELHGGCHLCIEGAGVSASLAACLGAARPMGRVVAMGNPAAGMALSQSEYWAILRKQLTLRGTWNSSYKPGDNDWADAMEAFGAGLDVARFITHRVGLESGMQPFCTIRDKKEFTNKVMFVMQGGSK